eukprot:m.331729 g.331729  ORF g.331729 m.331729 type:complete len:207 (-) comp16789_c0_seq1:5120-5740(-)
MGTKAEEADMPPPAYGGPTPAIPAPQSNASFSQPNAFPSTPSEKPLSLETYEFSVYDPAAGRAFDNGEVPTGYLSKPSNHGEGGILFINAFKSMSKGSAYVVPKRITASNILTGSILDLSRGRFIYPETTIVANQILGGCRVIVPQGVRVVCKGVGILGSFGKNMEESHAKTTTSSPTITVVGMSILAGMRVTVNNNVPAVKAIST